MTNERLRASMAAAHVDVERLADKVGVDEKTVQRWLGGRLPHRRNRWQVAEVVGEDDDYLWPPEERGEGGAAPNAELVRAYNHRADAPAEEWWRLVSSAQQQVDLLGYALLFLMEQHPQLPPLLHRKALDGCRVRIALADPDSPQVAERDEEEGLGGGLRARIRTARLYFGVLDESPGVEIHYHRTPMYNSVARGDGEMFVTPHLHGTPGFMAPLLHLRRKGGQGLFDSFAEHFEGVWSVSWETVPVSPAGAEHGSPGGSHD